MSKTNNLTILEPLKFHFEEILQFSKAENDQNLTFKSPETIKMTVFYIVNSFHVKSEWQKNISF